jgi:hypothetical protein
VDPAVAIGGQVGDHGLDGGHEVVGRDGRTPDPLSGASPDLLDKIGASDPEHVGHLLHREPAEGSNTDPKSPLLGPAATSSASLSTSASSVFLPKSLWSSRPWFWSAR